MALDMVKLAEYNNDKALEINPKTKVLIPVDFTWQPCEIDEINDVSVEMTFDPPWSPDLITEDGKAVLGI